MERNISLEFLKQSIQNENITIELDGIITTVMEFEQINIEIEEDIFRIIAGNSSKFEIKLAQIKSINKNEEGIFEVITDQLEKVIIKCH